MKPARSFLFVPGNKADWIHKAAASKADALILDLEDSVPGPSKIEAREIVSARLQWLAQQGQRTWVRVNRSPYLYDFDDILAVVGPFLEGVVISKPIGPEDIDTASSMLSEAEHRKGVAQGQTRMLAILETARSMQLAHEIALRPRVAAITGLSTKNGDVARALDCGWTPEGRETLYLKSRVVMAARAAGKLPIGGLWQQVHDLKGLQRAVELDRELGMAGQLVLHPSNVPTVNRVYSPSPQQVAYYRGLIEVLEAAQAQGRASALYDGEHVDIAHLQTARAVVELANASAPA